MPRPFPIEADECARCGTAQALHLAARGRLHAFAPRTFAPHVEARARELGLCAHCERDEVGHHGSDQLCDEPAGPPPWPLPLRDEIHLARAVVDAVRLKDKEGLKAALEAYDAATRRPGS